MTKKKSAIATFKEKNPTIITETFLPSIFFIERAPFTTSNMQQFISVDESCGCAQQQLLRDETKIMCSFLE
jgi:hypothetical protein